MRKWKRLLMALCCLWLTSCGRGRLPVGRQVTPGRPIPSQAGPGALKIVTHQAGMVRFSAVDLRPAGFPAGEFDPGQVRVSNRGQVQPVWLQGQGEKATFVFYAAPSGSLYTLENITMLEWGRGPGQAMGEESLTPQPGPAEITYTATLHLEENRSYAPQVEEGDHWMGQALSAPQEASFPFDLQDITQGPGKITLEAWAGTEAPVSPDHHLRLTLNGQAILDQTWDGRGRRRLEAVFPPGLLAAGDNTLQVSGVGDTGAPADIVSVDWIEVEYPRASLAQAGRLEFTGRGKPQELSGLRGRVDVFDITEAGRAKRSGGGETQDGKLIFSGQSGRHYLAVDETGYGKPDRIQPVLSSPNLRATGSGADYVAIGPPDLLEPLTPLLEWRAGQGLKPLAVPLEAIYDQFGGGLPEPEAIRAFLQYAVKAWQPAPRYVLLVGDATYDPRGYLSPPEANRLPALFVQTDYGGQTASDVLFTLLDGSQQPGLALGRVPARQPGQVKVFVEKTLAYEKDPAPGQWRRHILAIADGQEPGFRDDARHFLDDFTQAPAGAIAGAIAGYQGKLYAPEAGTADAAGQILSSLNEGALFAAYFGHGSLGLWGKDRLFSIEDVGKLRNAGRLPVIIQMTCLTGLFTHPKNESLSERFLFQEGAGAVALLAPTSLTLPLDQGFLSDALAQAYLADPTARLGDIFLSAQRQLPLDNPGTREVMLTYLLFGDPGLRLVGE